MAKQVVYGFDDIKVAKRLKEIAGTGRGTAERPVEHPPGEDNPFVPASRVFVCKTPVGGIPARSGTTVGSATCDVYYINDSNVLTQYSEGGVNMTIVVKNLSTTAVAGSVYIIPAQERVTGRYVAVWEDC
jgi:hypothetical protein